MAKILGMGNALVDIMVQLENDQVIHNFELLKGGMRLVDDEFIQALMNAIKLLPIEYAPGGSAANTMNGLSNLGTDTGFIGKVSEDRFGKILEEDMVNNGIKPFLLKSNAPTGLAVALVSPDFERTFAVNLGCAIELSSEDITSEMFSGYDFFHIEGYMVQNQELLREAVVLARENNVKVSLDLASFDVVQDNLSFLKEMISEYVDIVFANENEAKAFTNMDPEQALHEISKTCEVSIVKIGEKGSLINHQGNTHTIGVIEVKSIDTTGTGDLYAAGFLYGMAKNIPLQKCGLIGSLLAGKVIEVLGAKMNEDTWNIIRKEVEKILSQ